jgi:hypothetical protein
VPVNDEVDHPVVAQELRALEAVWQLLADRLLDDARAREADERAGLGDVQLAEPGALIGFAGQRVIEQTIREKLPEGFQRAEYLLEHGIIDMVVKRTEMKSTLARIIGLLRVKDLPEAA